MGSLSPCAVAALSAAIGLSSLFSSAAAAPVPLVAGNYQIAYDFLHGDTHALLFGDSLQNGSGGLYPSRWHIDKWSGQVAGGASFIGDTGVWTYTATAPYIASNDDFTAVGMPPDGISGSSPGPSHHVLFGAGTAGPDSGLVSNRIAEVNLSANQGSVYYSGKWADRSTGQITADLLLYANPQGVTGGVEFDVYINSTTTPVVSIPISTRSNTPGLIKQTVTFPAQAWAPGNSIRGVFRLTAGAAAEPGANLIYAGARYSNGEPGFQLANIATGGIGIDYYLDPALCSDETLKRSVDATDTNTCFVWLGQNDPENYDGAQWKAKLQGLIARYRAARADMRFVLCAT
jgi:hypothetical protein